ncbi:hypothetical protein GCM10007857_70050 [Bradyrhizobium iriomotense]|uniref:Uncharacterized protein n=1 Tax=Bradyrhizobium iriomotense TaxID=441950 RepID=A0ABQ6BCB6_9BRAD|nr:hypothetical protein GCM10007857_70050 [Bradyrhizobium iriomotense]
MVRVYDDLTVGTRPSIATVRSGWSCCAIVSLPLFLPPLAPRRPATAVTEFAARSRATRQSLCSRPPSRNVDKNLFRKLSADNAFETRGYG